MKSTNMSAAKSNPTLSLPNRPFGKQADTTLSRRAKRLLSILQWKRPHDSQTEKHFINKYILKPYAHLKPHLMGPMMNIVITIPGDEKTLFSCHTDTVHSKAGKQIVTYDANMGLAYKKPEYDGSKKDKNAYKDKNKKGVYRRAFGDCLGADDGAGIFIMLEMIDAKVPGTYVFHRGEEKGGIGSGWMAEHKDTWLKTFDRAIAFDRKSTDSVITSQSCGDCCSDEFAEALCNILNDNPIPANDQWTPDPTGTFTDTANYAFLISECTNLSVGYDFQHTPDEYQDVAFAEQLVEKLINIKWSELPTVRDPIKAKITEDSRFTQWQYDWDERRNQGHMNSLRWPMMQPPTRLPDPVFPKKDERELAETKLTRDYLEYDSINLVNLDFDDLVMLCEFDPDWAAGLIFNYAQNELVKEASDASDFAQ